MKRVLLFILLFLFVLVKGQNYYAPFNETIKDTSSKFVPSKIGVYISAAFGSGNVAANSNPVALFSCSIAYKSHLFSLTRAGYGQLEYGGSQGETTYNANYIGLLYGESIRFKHFMISLSAGIAYSDILISENLSWVPPIVSYQGISFPIELKGFILARNGIGLGVHISKNIISPFNNSPFYFGVAIVFGGWSILNDNKNHLPL